MPEHKDITGDQLHVPGYCQASDPGTVGAGAFWIDTSAGTGLWRLYIRNDTNTAWERASLPAVFETDMAAGGPPIDAVNVAHWIPFKLGATDGFIPFYE